MTNTIQEKLENLQSKVNTFQQQSEKITRSLNTPELKSKIKNLNSIALAAQTTLETHKKLTGKSGVDLHAAKDQLEQHIEGYSILIHDSDILKLDKNIAQTKNQIGGIELKIKTHNQSTSKSQENNLQQTINSIQTAFRSEKKQFEQKINKLYKVDKNLLANLGNKINDVESSLKYLEKLEIKKTGWIQIYDLIKANIGSATFGMTGIFVLLGVAYLMGLYGSSDYLTIIKYTSLQDLSLTTIRYAMPCIFLFFLMIVVFYGLSKTLINTSTYPSRTRRLSNTFASILANKVVFFLAVFFLPLTLSILIGNAHKSTHKNHITVELTNGNKVAEVFESFIISGDYYLLKVSSENKNEAEKELAALKIENESFNQQQHSSSAVQDSKIVISDSPQAPIETLSIFDSISSTYNKFLSSIQILFGSNIGKNNERNSQGTLLVYHKSEVQCLRAMEFGGSLKHMGFKNCTEIVVSSDMSIEREAEIVAYEDLILSLQLNRQLDSVDFTDKYLNLAKQYLSSQDKIRQFESQLANFDKTDPDLDSGIRIDQLNKLHSSIKKDFQSEVSLILDQIKNIKPSLNQPDTKDLNYQKIRSLLTEFQVCLATTRAREQFVDLGVALFNDGIARKKCFHLIEQAANKYRAMGIYQYEKQIQSIKVAKNPSKEITK